MASVNRSINSRVAEAGSGARVTAVATQTQSAPDWATCATLDALIPPIATIGTVTRWVTERNVDKPAGLVSDFVAVEKIEPTAM